MSVSTGSASCACMFPAELTSRRRQAWGEPTDRNEVSDRQMRLGMAGGMRWIGGGYRRSPSSNPRARARCDNAPIAAHEGVPSRGISIVRDGGACDGGPLSGVADRPPPARERTLGQTWLTSDAVPGRRHEARGALTPSFQHEPGRDAPLPHLASLRTRKRAGRLSYLALWLSPIRARCVGRIACP